MSNFEFFSNLEFLRRALIAPDAATDGGSSPRLCVDRACLWLMLPFYRGDFCAGIHIPYVVGFRQVVCAIGGVTRGAWFALRCIRDDAAAEQPSFTVSKRGRT